MTSVVVVVPSRGRPSRAAETVDAIRRTAVRVTTSVNLVVDADDPMLDGYRSLRWSGDYGVETWLTVLDPDETGNLVRATNTASLRIAQSDPACIIGNLGDDHLPRSIGWDRDIINALSDPGIAYGDDGIHGEHLPSAPFISASIVLALGWYALPTCHHLYIDDAWRELGRSLGRLHYLPEVLIEHMHPSVGKAEWDTGYWTANSTATDDHDKVAFSEWRTERMASDADTVRRALEAAA